MHFMIMHKNGSQTEAGQKPPMELVTKMCRRYAEILGGTLEIDVRVVDRRGEDEAHSAPPAA